MAITRQNPSSAESDAEYTDRYNAGWRYSARGSSLDAADRKGLSRSEGFMDGYLDQATGRAKWHYRDCADHTGYGEGHGCGEA